MTDTAAPGLDTVAVTGEDTPVPEVHSRGFHGAEAGPSSGSLNLVLAGSGALVAYLAWRSLGWPLIHDAPLMHYIAWIVAQGGVPYRDAFDMNLPAVYLIHAALIAVGGRGDLAWRLFDVGWLSATSAVLWRYGRPLGRGPAAAGALLFALYHLSGGAWRAGQRDFLLCLFLIAGALGIARSIERGGAVGPLIWGGLALGGGLAVKPHAGLFWLASAALAGWGARRHRRSALRAIAIVVGVGVVPTALVLGWLGWRGGLGAFIAVFTGYVIPLYGRMGRDSLGTALRGYEYGALLWSGMGMLAVLGMCRRSPTGGVRRAIALIGAVCGALHFLLQGKYWEYQLYPLALFLCALAAFALPQPARAYAWSRRALAGLLGPASLAGAAGLAGFALTVYALGAKGVDALEPEWITAKAKRVAALTRDVAALAPPGATVQVMDVTEGGVHALWNLGRRQPTRFIYDFHFFHHTDDPRIRALRAEFVSGLAAGRPAAVVVLRDTWNREGYDRLNDWPALAQFLERSYVLALEGDGYRIYAKRPDS